LSPGDRADYQNAKKLIQFFSQNFSVAEKFSGQPGEYFTLEQTLSGIEEILGVGKKPEAETATQDETSDQAPASEGDAKPPEQEHAS